MKKNRRSGFTLIELMITVAIIAVLAAIAYPSYSRYATQARRSDAQIAIQQMANQLEKYFGTCSAYTTDIVSVPANRGCPGDAAPVPADGSLGFGASGNLSPDGHYLIAIAVDNIGGTCVAAGGPCVAPAPLTAAQCQARCGYTITAAPVVGGRQAGDGNFRMDNRGIKQWDKNNDGDYIDAGENKWK